MGNKIAVIIVHDALCNEELALTRIQDGKLNFKLDELLVVARMRKELHLAVSCSSH